MAGMWASAALRPRYGATAAVVAARRACRIVIVPSSTGSTLEGAGSPAGGRTHGGEEDRWTVRTGLV
jgi:hypothetical protein